ncbi:DUF6622 family protein [Ramlibacter humi]|uniref:DUF1453 domain-containing protein n=1 Tax=Ramlibacter humi TaxID=2530451 RepID=A0A4Z0CBY2_9BURK|nr:DUF6622 family protein [Ramlibacter humi]TFZ08881.1 hypothetical protein EZ216_06995 [Ramlibacter humi]
MLIQLVTQHPEALPRILQSTPTWVWGLFAGLLALGFSQVRGRTMSLLRVSLVPFVMAGFGAWGMFSAFGNAPHGAMVVGLWIATAAIVAAVVGMGRSHATYDAATRSYAVPGSFMPLLMIAGIFLVKWSVGVELALQPPIAQDTSFGLAIALVYGVFNGLFAGRAARLWRLAFNAPVPARAAA